jgi:hypothetical protein
VPTENKKKGNLTVVNNLQFERLDPNKHDRINFDCGEETLNIFLKIYAFQQQKEGFCTTHVCIDKNHPNKIKPILGYYTISASSIEAVNADYFSKRKLPYKNIPTIKIGRLARDINESPKGFGKFILETALGHCLEFATNHIGIWAVEVDLINEHVKPFYEAFDFKELPEFPLRLLLPISKLKKASNTNH